MEKNYQVQEEIKRTLQSLEGLKPAEPAPFFYTRLQARMEKKKGMKVSWRWEPAYAYAFLGVVIFLNVLTIYQVSHRSSNAEPGEQFVNYYGLNYFSGFDTN
jgi:hypothetical protein